MMLRFAICDDEKEMRTNLAGQIRAILESLDIKVELFSYADSVALLEAHTKLYFDAVFLDIEMEGLSGLEAAEKLREQNDNVRIIFVTDHDDMVFQSLQYTPLRFVRKSKVSEELNEAVISVLTDVSRVQERYCLETKEGIRQITIQDILYFEVLGHLTTCHMKNGCIELRETLKKIEEDLKVHGFVRTHNSYLVNCRYIEAVEKKEVLLTEDGLRIPLSRQKQELVKQQLMQSMRR